MKWILFTLFLALSVLVYAPSVSAQQYNDNSQYNNPSQDYSSGYQQGYDRGQTDRNNKQDFDPRNTFQSASPDFQSGFQQGYKDGYAGRAATVAPPIGPDQNRQTGPDQNQPMGPDQNQNGPAYQPNENQNMNNQDTYNNPNNEYNPNSDAGNNMGVVQIFSATGFRGQPMSLGMGRLNTIDLADVQSLRINGNVRVIVFNEPDFHGRSVILTQDTPTLRGMQNGPDWSFGLLKHQTGSIIVEPLH